MLANLNSLHPYNDLKRLPHIVKETGVGANCHTFYSFCTGPYLKV